MSDASDAFVTQLQSSKKETWTQERQITPRFDDNSHPRIVENARKLREIPGAEPPPYRHDTQQLFNGHEASKETNPQHPPNTTSIPIPITQNTHKQAKTPLRIARKNNTTLHIHSHTNNPLRVEIHYNTQHPRMHHYHFLLRFITAQEQDPTGHHAKYQHTKPLLSPANAHPYGTRILETAHNVGDVPKKSFLHVYIHADRGLRCYWVSADRKPTPRRGMRPKGQIQKEKDPTCITEMMTGEDEGGFFREGAHRKRMTMCRRITPVEDEQCNEWAAQLKSQRTTKKSHIGGRTSVWWRKQDIRGRRSRQARRGRPPRERIGMRRIWIINRAQRRKKEK